jgi:hypothetical protein
MGPLGCLGGIHGREGDLDAAVFFLGGRCVAMIGLALRSRASGTRGGVREIGDGWSSHVAECKVGFEVAARSRVADRGCGHRICVRARRGTLRLRRRLSL